MYFSDRIKLRTVTSTFVDGIYTDTATTKEVWADVQSAKRSEFYSALSAGQRVDIVFVVNTDDYTEQTEVEYRSKVYKVLRVYQTTPDYIELTCTRG